MVNPVCEGSRWLASCETLMPDDLRWSCNVLESEVTQSCTTLCNSYMDCSPPGSSVHGILQARTLAWIAIPFSRGPS